MLKFARRGFVLRCCRTVLVAGGCTLLGYCAMVWTEAWVFQRQQSREFSSILSHRATPVARVVAHAAHPHSVLGRLEIPRLGISAMVAEGDSARTLKHAIGHLPGTSWPGQGGNVVLAGHRDTFFRPLRHVHKGDEIIFTTWNGRFRYRVDSVKVVKPSATKVLAPSSKPLLTLVTCY